MAVASDMLIIVFDDGGNDNDYVDEEDNEHDNGYDVDDDNEDEQHDDNTDEYD